MGVPTLHPPHPPSNVSQSMATAQPNSPSDAAATQNSEQSRPWLLAQIQSLLLLAALGWLLARLVWLYYFFGLFFYLVAGLLVGALAFRTARAARPLPRARLLRGIIMITLGATAITVTWEYRHFSATVGQPPKFADARNRAIQSGGSSRDIVQAASEEFEKHLSGDHAPGGVIGYVVWSVRSGKMPLTIDGTTETIANDHAGWVWPVRTLAGAVLLAVGMWFGLESLRSPIPVANVLRPGEEYSEDV